MEDTKFDIKKVIEDMKALKDKRITEIVELNNKNGVEMDPEELSSQITIKYLGKMELVNEQGELAEKDVYMTIEQIDGQFQIRYYDENQNMLGIQRTMDDEIMLSSGLSSVSIDEQERIKKELEEKDKEEAKTQEELEEEQAKQEPQQLPGLEGPQLTSEQVDRMTGPKVRLNQIVDGETLGNVIGLSGVQMQLIDSELAKKLIPELQIPTSQRTVPIEIFSDGSANVIGEDKLQFSAIEGMNADEQHVTTTNEGTTRSEQNLETFNITSTGGMHTIAIGYDEGNGQTPLEAKYGRRDVEDPRKISYIELETVHEGPLQQADETWQAQQSVAEGTYKGQEQMDDAVEIYAKAMNIRETDEHGYPTSEYDLEAARQELEARWAENPDLTLEELIDEGQKQQGPGGNPRQH